MSTGESNSKSQADFNREDAQAEIARETQEALDMSIVGSAALAKACCDHFDYACRLRTGEVIRFSDCAIISKEWLNLTISEFADQPLQNKLAFPAERGIDVRISDIVWVMDAPEGS